MQSVVIFSIIVAISYFIINKYKDKTKSVKTLTVESVSVFISVIVSNYLSDFLGYASILNKPSVSTVGAFTTNPDF